jgi:hypothetical protein
LVGHAYDFTHHLIEQAPRVGVCRTGADATTKRDRL